MKRNMRERLLIVFFFVAALAVLTSCGGGVQSASWFGLAAADDVIYLAAHGQVFAHDPGDSGAVLWSFPSEPDSEVGPFYATPLLNGNTLKVGGYGDGKLYALSPNGGAEAWSVETEAPIVEGAASINGGVVVGNDQGEVYVVDEETQNKRLLLKAEGAIWATPLVDEVNGRVYVASMDHNLYAVDLDSGEKLWPPFKANGALVGTPALSDGVIFFGSLNSAFYALDAETGDELWPAAFETEGWVWGGPLVDGDTVFFGDMAGYLYALDAKDKSEKWPPFKAEGGVRATPVLLDGLLYFGTQEGKVYALNAEDGSQHRMLSLSGSIFTRLVLAGDYLLVAPHNAKERLVALDPESLEKRWAYPPQEE